MTDFPRVLLAVITGAHGLRGEVKLHCFGDDPHALESYPLTDKTGARRFTLRITKQAGNQPIAQISGINSRNDAELLRGTELYTETSALPPPAEHEIYHHSLLGLTVLDAASGAALGTVVAVQNFGASDILEWQRADGSTEMLPFTHQFFGEIDAEKRTILCHVPDYVEADRATPTDKASRP